MAVNKPLGDNARVGAVKNRSQTYNPKTKKIVKRNATTGEFLKNKITKGIFKGIRKEK
jgi:hypothetical protein